MTADDNSPIAIRAATPEDYSGIISLWDKADLPYSPNGRESRSAFEQQLEQWSRMYLLAECDKQIVGSVFGTHDGRKGWINRLAVHPAYRRRGIATLLIDTCDQAIRAQGIDIIAVLIAPENTPSIALFRRMRYAADVPALYFRKKSRPDI